MNQHTTYARNPNIGVDKEKNSGSEEYQHTIFFAPVFALRRQWPLDSPHTPRTRWHRKIDQTADFSPTGSDRSDLHVSAPAGSAKTSGVERLGSSSVAQPQNPEWGTDKALWFTIPISRGNTSEWGKRQQRQQQGNE